ncbi:VF530 family DNA-binding protein [Agaribacterium haliotis]|uniref:VF530 family protein n=1 Tax=Agaribacterium haliotis TaxID=2013869 RepID=UPI000BB58434|nr:VF530 family DNA-binding protein [Agaribacterium haliotis]
MTDDINYKNNPLHGLSLKNMLIELVDHYGYDILHAYLNLNCFSKNPDIASSVKFLKKTDWAREKVESFYLYQYKSLPRCSDEQFALSPRDRIVPDGQQPGEPAELSLEDAERLKQKRERKAEQRRGGGASRAYDGAHRGGAKHSAESKGGDESSSSSDPWARARAKHKS